MSHSAFPSLDDTEPSTAFWCGFGGTGGRYREGAIQQFSNAPNPIRKPEADGWCGPKGFMYSAKIVVSDVE